MNAKGGKTLFLLILLSAGIIAIFAVGFEFGKIQGYAPPIEGVTNLEAGKPEYVDFSLFWDAWRVIQEKYVDAAKLNYQAMVQGAIKGMVESLGDPYTAFLNPQDTKRFLEDVSGSFEGIGMEIGIREKKLKVIAPLEGTPAQKAGIRSGDHMVKIGDTFTNDMTLDEAVSLIRGPKGTTVELEILRDDWTKAQKFVIERDVIKIPALRWELKEGNIAYLKLFHFSEKANREFQKVAGEILLTNARKLILDLRNNPGGFLEIAVDIAGWFIKNGEVVVIEDFGTDQTRKEYKARGNARFGEYTMVVLINEGSASASEILAGALRDHHGVLLMGKNSFGKGSVQELEKLKDDSSIKVTVANWLTPKGILITGKGLTVDQEVEITEEDFSNNRDPQMEKALEVLRNL
ncbi:MAG: S41 family peptidase [Patescibacteria group bacterium]